MKRNFSIWILAGFVLLAILFIFCNSLQNGPESKEASNTVMEFLRPVLDLIPGLEDPENREFVIRKGAHLFEFFLLGVLSGSFAVVFQRRFGKPFWAHVLFLALLAAVIDEFIQSFTGRTSEVSDVLIDFAGALIGFVAVLLMDGIIHLVRRRRTGEKTTGED